MNYLISKLKKIIQNIVDKISGKSMDILSAVLYLLIFAIDILSIYKIIHLAKTMEIIIPINSIIYTIMIALPFLVFYISLMGDYFKIPSKRLEQFLFCVFSASIISISYLAEISNITIVNLMSGLRNIDKIPEFMILGNIKFVTFIVPSIAILPITFLTLKLVKDDDIRMDIIEYEVDMLLPNVYKMDDTTIDLVICKDIETGEKCIVPEKKLFEHIWLQGGTGSGKTATTIKPILGQLFEMKNKLIQKQKELAFEALREGIAELTQPVSNHWINNNFTMDLIKPKDGKREEFIKKFQKYIVGIRDKEEIIEKRNFNGGNIELNLPKKKDSYYIIEIKIILSDITIFEKTYELKTGEILDKLELNKKFEPITVEYMTSTQNDEEIIEKIKNDNIIEEKEERIVLHFPKLKNEIYDITIKEKGSGKIIYKNLGVTVVAPDGGLPDSTIKIAEKFNIKVHKIDPKLEEIKKGHIAKFNPLLGDSPEKIGDIVSSILVSMEEADGAKSKAYFINASVRAIRNLVILLKVMYPRIYNCEPTLEDVLHMLNNFNDIVPLVEEMKKDEKLKNRWGSVIDYFVTNFYPPLTDSNGNKVVGSSQGSQRKKTQEAISGVINQLDNFLGRQEIKYIFCDRQESLDLDEVLEKGDCIAIATRFNELGEKLGRAFALFFILSIQNKVLSRYSEEENPEIPFFLIIDEFPFYVNENTKVFFTFARKYKCSVLIAIQNIGQLKVINDEFGETIFTNTDTKILLPKSNVEDRKYWAEYFGTKEEMDLQTGISTTPLMSENPTFRETRRGGLKAKKVFTEQVINDLTFQQALYSFTNSKGRRKIGKGTTDFLKIDESKIYKSKFLDFEQFNPYSLQEHIKRKQQENIEKENKKEDKEDIDDLLMKNRIDIKEHIVSENTKETKEERELFMELTDSEIENLQLEENSEIEVEENIEVQMELEINDNKKEINNKEQNSVELKDNIENNTNELEFELTMEELNLLNKKDDE